MIGRIAFPIYCFLLVEGFVHTKNRRKYGMRLFAFALISELPWNFVHTGGLFCGSQNVMFTLFFGYCALCVTEYLSNDKLKQIGALALLLLLCSFGKIDYGASGLGLILIMYFLKERKAIQAICAGCMLSNGYAAALAFIPINLYNGERGCFRGNIAKYAAYLFYPVHLLLIGMAKYWLA